LVYEQRPVVDRTALLLGDLGQAEGQGEAREEALTTGERADGSYGAAAERVVDVQLESGVRGALRLLEGELVPPGRHVPEVRVAVREHLAEDRAQHERLQVHPRLALHLSSGEVVEPLGR